MSTSLQQWMLHNRLWVIVGFVVVYTCMIAEFICITRATGGLKRGICVSRQKMQLEQIHRLQQLQNQTRYKQWLVLRQNQEVLFARRDFSRLWYLWYFPYIGYIDLEKENAMLEYRTPFSNMIIWLTLLFVSAVSVVLLPKFLVPLSSSVAYYYVLGGFGFVICFNLLIFFLAHKDEVRRLRAIVAALANNHVSD